jgi:hypothetical protein
MGCDATKVRADAGAEGEGSGGWRGQLAARAEGDVPSAFFASLLFGDEVMLELDWVEMAEAAIWVGGDDGDVGGCCPWLYVRSTDPASLTTQRSLSRLDPTADNRCVPTTRPG